MQSEFDTLMDQKIEKTPMESLKKRNNKIKDKVNKLPEVSQKKQSLDEDTKLKTDAMQWDVKVCMFMTKFLLPKSYFFLI